MRVHLASQTAISSSRTTRSKYGAKLFVVADHDDARAGCSALRQTAASRNAPCRSRSSAEVGSSATIDLRRADQRAGGGNALLLADAQARGSYGCRSPCDRGRGLQQPHGVVLEPSLRRVRAHAASREKLKRQQHVVDERAVGQQVEHLEDDAEVLGAEAVARGADSAPPCRCQARRPARDPAQRSRKQAEERASCRCPTARAARASRHVPAKNLQPKAQTAKAPATCIARS